LRALGERVALVVPEREVHRGREVPAPEVAVAAVSGVGDLVVVGTLVAEHRGRSRNPLAL
jgi:hypothetical protein